MRSEIVGGTVFKSTSKKFFLHKTKAVVAKVKSYFITTVAGDDEVTISGEKMALAEYEASPSTQEIEGEITIDGESINYN